MSNIVAILGSRPRYFLDLGAAFRKVRDYIRALPPETVVVSGGADGIDSFAEQLAAARGLGTGVFPVTKEEWARDPRGAGFARTERLLKYVKDEGGRVACFRGMASPGTSYTIRRCQELGIPLEVFDE